MRRKPLATVLTVMVLALVTACTGSEAEPAPPPKSPEAQERRITVWSRADSARGVAATNRIIAGFTAATGIKVDLVPVGSARLYGLVRRTSTAPTTAPATPNSSGAKIPDVIGALPLASAQALAAGGLLDTSAASEIVSELGRDTFQERALELTSRDGEQFAVPSHAWTRLLIYRKDMFAKAGLPVPDTFAKIRTAAKKLDTDKRAGIALPTAADEPATTRTFEHFALANRCRLLGRSDAVALSSDNCVDTFDYYGRLASHGLSRGDDAEAARKAYLAGKAAIIPASSAILDDLGGLDTMHPQTCGQCEQDPAFLAKNSGIVTTIRGSHGIRPVQYGGMGSWAITATADTDAAQQFVSYMMGEGYLEWLGMAPGGHFPVRIGTEENPQKFTNAWATLPAGTTNTSSLSDLYPSTVLDLLRSSPNNFRWWTVQHGQDAPVSEAWADGKAALVARVYGEHPVAEALNQLIRGEIDPAAAAKQARRQVDGFRSKSGASPTRR